MPEWVGPIWTAFTRLSASDRPSSMEGIARIPFAAIRAYAEAFGWTRDPEDFDTFYQILSLLDEEVVRVQHENLERKRSSKGA